MISYNIWKLLKIQSNTTVYHCVIYDFKWHVNVTWHRFMPGILLRRRKHRTISQSMNITAYHTLHNVQVLSIMNCMVFCWWKKGSPDFRKITNSVSIKSMQCHVVPLEFIILNLLKNISPSLSIYSIQCQIQTLPQW